MMPPLVEAAATVDPDRGRTLMHTSGGRAAETAFRAVTIGAGLVVLAALGLIAWSTTAQSWEAVSAQGSSFFFSSNWAPNQGQFGALAFVYGTLVVSVLALAVSIPVSLGIALFVTEAASKRVATAVGYTIDLLAAVPSVVYGLWGVLVVAPIIGKSFFTAGLIVGLMITPIVTSLTREVLRTVPDAQREAALALGATRWEMIRASVLPWAKGGIVGSVMLGLGRAMGETIAVALVIGASPQITADIFKGGDAMAAVIVNQFGEASGVHRSALIGLGVTLFVLTILVNSGARAFVYRADRKMRA